MFKQKMLSYHFPATHEKEQLRTDDFLKAKTNLVLRSGKKQNCTIRIQAVYKKLHRLSNANMRNYLLINYLLLVNIICEVFIG